MAVQLALFNHKGGVSKTTTAFNLGWMLAEKGKRVLLIDCDPQCNLTGMVLGFSDDDDFKTIYDRTGVTSIYEGVLPAFEARPTPIVAVECIPVSGNNNLFLMPGHIGLSELEVTLGIAQDLSGTITTLQNLPGAFRHLFDKTAEKYNIDIIIIDMSPSLGSINQNLLMTSDYFLVPTAPDFFSVMALQSLASVIPRWVTWAERLQPLPHLKNSIYPFEYKQPKFLGTIIQNYRVRSGNTPSRAFTSWIREIKNAISKSLVPVLTRCNVILPKEMYNECGRQLPEPIMQLGNFNSLIAQSQKYKLPIYKLNDSTIEQSGIVLERTKKSMEKFKDIFSAGADFILCLLSHDTSAR